MNQKSVSKCFPFGMQHHKDCICDMGTQMYLLLSELISARQEIYCKKILKPKGNVYIVQILCLHLLLCPNVCIIPHLLCSLYSNGSHIGYL